VINSVSPNQVEQYDTITEVYIMGQNFGTAMGTITVNGVTANIETWTPTQVSFHITMNTPPANPTLLTLRRADGANVTTTLFRVINRLRPFIFGYTPNQVCQGDVNTTIVMTGTQFGTSGTVVLAGIYTATISLWSDTIIVFHIDANTPALSPIYVHVTSVPNGQYKEFGMFSVISCGTPTPNTTATRTSTPGVVTGTPTATDTPGGATVTPTSTPGGGSSTPTVTATPGAATVTPTGTAAGSPGTPSTTPTNTAVPSTSTPTTTVTVTPTVTNTGTATQTPSPTATCVSTTTRTGAISNTDPLQYGALSRDFSPSVCLPKTCPLLVDKGQHHYDEYSFVNSTGVPQCITITLMSACAGANDIYSATYLNSFDPTNLCTNYVGDIGRSPGQIGGSASYSVVVPAGATFVVTVYEFTANAGCATYTLTLNGCY
jgi:hypothetical protein